MLDAVDTKNINNTNLYFNENCGKFRKCSCNVILHKIEIMAESQSKTISDDKRSFSFLLSSLSFLSLEIFFLFLLT